MNIKLANGKYGTNSGKYHTVYVIFIFQYIFITDIKENLVLILHDMKVLLQYHFDLN